MARSRKRRSRHSGTRRRCPGSGERVVTANQARKDEMLLALRLALTVLDFVREWLDSGNGLGRIR